mmetsp:Transcript_33595/g.61576  ORF Transcript_33595/g.61576 Transcript_33595/m.61576 type:complete len:246 (+) Transcript_33595:189-926(+)
MKAAAANVAGKLELVDSVSDALAAASAFHLSETACRRYDLSMAGLPLGLRLMSTTLGMGGLLTAALAYSTLLFLLVMRVFGSEMMLIWADLAGFTSTAEKLKATGALGRLPEARERLNARSDMIVKLAKVYGEAAWQALLQTSLIMAKGLPLFDQPLLLASVLLSCVTLASKALQLVFTLRRNMELEGEANANKYMPLVVYGPSLLCLWAILGLVIAKLYYTEACEDRLWGISTGCVDVPPDFSS